MTTVPHDRAGQQQPTKLLSHLRRSALLESTQAEDSHIITVTFPGDIKRDYFVGFHVTADYGTPAADYDGILGYQYPEIVIDGVLDADTGEAVELSEGRRGQLLAILADMLEGGR